MTAGFSLKMLQIKDSARFKETRHNQTNNFMVHGRCMLSANATTVNT